MTRLTVTLAAFGLFALTLTACGGQLVSEDLRSDVAKTTDALVAGQVPPSGRYLSGHGLKDGGTDTQGTDSASTQPPKLDR